MTDSISAIAIGAPDPNEGSGTVDLLLLDQPTFGDACPRLTLRGNDQGGFGWSLALTASKDSGFLAVGAPFEQYPSGSVYTYMISLRGCSVEPLHGGNTLPNPSQSSSFFGWSLSFGQSGSNEGNSVLTQLLIGSPSLAAFDEGEAHSYVYDFENKVFELEQIFTPDVNIIGFHQAFGYCVAASSQSLFAVGSPFGEL